METTWLVEEFATNFLNTWTSWYSLAHGVFLLFAFCGAGDQTEGLEHGRQATTEQHPQSSHGGLGILEKCSIKVKMVKECFLCENEERRIVERQARKGEHNLLSYSGEVSNFLIGHTWKLAIWKLTAVACLCLQSPGKVCISFHCWFYFQIGKSAFSSCQYTFIF